MASRLSALAAALPGPVVHRCAAWSFRLRAEQRLLLLDELVDPTRPAIDAGAWWGPWTYWLSRRCPEVWSFEPNPRMAATLARVARSNVRLHSVALSDHAGTEQLWVPDNVGPDALATLQAEHAPGSARPVAVEVRRLDDFEIPAAGFLKIDVESHEPAMLRGATDTIRRCRPTVLIEVEQRFHELSVQTIFDVFLDEGYSGWFRRERQWGPLDDFDVERDQFQQLDDPKSTSYINNFVFSPGSAAPSAYTRAKARP